MSLGSWSPDEAKADLSVEEQWLRRCIDSVRANPDSVGDAFTEDEKQIHCEDMQLERKHWIDAAAPFSDAELIDLIRFYTLAEQQISGWHGGDRSPVIGLNKALKQRGEKLSKELLLWMREVSDNRFIPNGGL